MNNHIDYYQITQELTNKLQELAPHYVVTMDYREFHDKELMQGVLVVEYFGNPEYPAPLQHNELPRMEFVITGQLKIGERDANSLITKKQSEMINTIESLVINHPDSVEGLQLLSAEANGQIKAPYGAVFAKLINYGEPV